MATVKVAEVFVRLEVQNNWTEEKVRQFLERQVATGAAEKASIRIVMAEMEVADGG